MIIVPKVMLFHTAIPQLKDVLTDCHGDDMD